MTGRRVAVLLLAIGAAVACQPAASPSGSEAVPTPSSAPSSTTAGEAPTSAVGSVEGSAEGSGAIDPDWVTRPALTCGEPGRLFPPEALAGLGMAELGLDPAAAILRATLAETSGYRFPDRGWHRVIDDPDGVTFVAAGDDETPWWMVSVGLLGGTLQATDYGQCHLGIAAPDGVSLATWWLDPGGPPVTPETTDVAILLRERDCASGKPPEGRVLAPTIVPAANAFLVAIGIRKQLTDQDCQGNPAYPTRLVLPEPLGARGLFDANVFPPRRVTTEDPG